MLSGRVGYLENSVDNLSAIVVEMQSQGTESSHKVDAREEGMSIENSLIMEASYD